MKELPKEMELARDLLDKQVVDREETKMGRVDGLVLGRRLHPRIERWVDALRRRIGVQKTGRFRVPWSAVQEITSYHVKLDLDALKTPMFAWEQWLRDHVIDHLPRPLKGKTN
jgi:sporulation protein YlmC with PRC-barrel domain